MPQKGCHLDHYVMLRVPYAAQTDEAECNERSRHWPTVRTERSAETDAEIIAEDPRKHQRDDEGTRDN